MVNSSSLTQVKVIQPLCDNPQTSENYNSSIDAMAMKALISNR